MIDTVRKAIFLSAHPDDSEIGCGGTMARLAEAGVDICVVACSNLQPNLKEALCWTKINNIKFQCLGKQYRVLSNHRQYILDAFFQARESFSPDIVFMPASQDIHKDHMTVFEEGRRAFKGITTFGYEMPWNNITFSTHAFIEITEGQLNKKINAIAAYKSQAGRPYTDPAFTRAQATMRGVQAGTKYAEAFEVVRWVSVITKKTTSQKD